MNDIVYNGKVENGELHINNRASFIQEVKVFDGKDVEIIVRKKKRKRSLAMNRYYWAEVIPKVQQGLIDTGERLSLQQTDEWLRDFFQNITKDQAHEFVKDRFIEKVTIDEDTGEIIQNKITTTNMSTSQFQDYVAAIVQFAAEHLHTQILMPNEQASIELDDVEYLQPNLKQNQANFNQNDDSHFSL